MGSKGWLAVALRSRLLWILVVTVAAAGAVTYSLLQYAQNRVIEHQALTLAESVARLAAVARSVYSREVGDKLVRDGFGPHSEYKTRAGHVPLPAQFLKQVGEAASRDSEELYRYRPLSKWNLGAGQDLHSDFRRWAWAQLETQDRPEPAGPIDWRPVWRFQTDDGARVLHYLRADPASAASCVACHNAFEQRADIRALRVAAGVEHGKQWRQHQLMGAIEVTIPLAKVEAVSAAQTRLITGWILTALVLGLAVSCWFLVRDIGRTNRLQQLSWQASHDPLTGLANRRGFEDALERLLHSATLRKKPHALCLLDLDSFKHVNDTHGHEVGDRMLKRIAQQLLNAVRETDTVARLGGDEFAVLLTGCGREQAKTIAENLRAAVARTALHHRGGVLQTGASIGVVALGGRRKSADRILRAADRACYAAKRAGRNRVVLA